MKGYKIGFSEINDGKDLKFALITLDIPEGYPGLAIIASNSFNTFIFESATGRDYRSNVARVLSINKIEMRYERTYTHNVPAWTYIASASDEIMDHAFSIYDHSFYYHPGEIVFPDKFNNIDYRRCTNGIHFFRSQNDALNYINDKWVWYKFNLCKDDMLVKKGIDF